MARVRCIYAQSTKPSDAREALGGAGDRTFWTPCTYWIWWTLPIVQKRERKSRNNRFYVIRSLEEAKAYLGHSVLGRVCSKCRRLSCATGTRTLTISWARTLTRGCCSHACHCSRMLPVQDRCSIAFSNTFSTASNAISHWQKWQRATQ
jgi:uncharacterized protein (DUF1810 family)